MSESCILSHDVGTTGNKATLYSEKGELLASSTYGYQTRYPKASWAEQDPLDWWRGVCESTKRLLEIARISPGDVACMSFSGQMMGCLPVDKNGNHLRSSIIWADNRAVDEARAFKRAISTDKVYRITGTPITANYPAAKIMWVRNNQPEIYKKTYKFLQAKDYVAYRLTGKFATDYSDASTTNLLDIVRKVWCPEILGATGIEVEKLPDPCPSTTVIGKISQEAARQAGLLSGSPVVIGGGDGSCATVGAGVVKQGLSYMYLGSSSWVASATKEPLFDQKARTFIICHLDSELYTPIGTMQTAGGSYEWLKDAVCLTETQAAKRVGVSAYQIMDLKAETARPGADNLIFLPYLMGERSPYWNPRAKGAFIGLNKTHKREHLIRSVLEGVAYNLRAIMEALQEEGVRIDEVRLIGGGAKSWVLRQILADVCDKPLLRPLLLEEATSLGAAIAGGVGIGMFQDFSVAEKLVRITATNYPRPETRERYENLYLIFKDAYHALVPIFERIASL